MTSQISTPDQPEIVKTSDKRVACDGSEAELGHPRVYLTMAAEGSVDCPYCDRRFILIGGPTDQDA